MTYRKLFDTIRGPRLIAADVFAMDPGEQAAYEEEMPQHLRGRYSTVYRIEYSVDDVPAGTVFMGAGLHFDRFDPDVVTRVCLHDHNAHLDE